MKKTWVAVVAGIALVALTSVVTFFVIGFTGFDSEEYHDVSVSRRYNIFDGYSLCEAALKKTISGQVKNVVSDDRAAKYDRISNTNQMFFEASYLPEVGLFGAVSKIEKRLYARCDVSAETNVVEAISLREVDEEIFSEVHKQP